MNHVLEKAQDGGPDNIRINIGDTITLLGNDDEGDIICIAEETPDTDTCTFCCLAEYGVIPSKCLNYKFICEGKMAFKRVDTLLEQL